MTTYKLAVIPGSGIGHEVVPEAIRLLESTDLTFDCQTFEIGYDVFKKTGNSVPDEVINQMRNNTQACLFGATTTPLGVPGYKSAILTLRKAFDLYANIRPAKSLPLKTGFEGVDLVIVRENTEGLYSGMEFELPDAACSVRVITRKATERIVKYAFELSLKRRKQLTVVTKANIMRKSDGLFLEVARGIAKDYPEVEMNELLVDVAAMNLVMKPQAYDVIVTSNLFGDILSDEAAGLVGGLGLAPSANIGADYALFEPVHGSAPDIAGKGIANPMAAIMAAKMMLDYFGETSWAKRVETALLSVLENGKVLTPDLGGSSSTGQVTDAIIEEL
ncbi:MAG: isocitrate/isopropylmalate dehydrogenase family protein [Candidatus Bathyarchaeota archaeon]|nr:isocitrate/isopropylmalate dehydrogenase family protein [Candidatus Bathyarchaeum tardum]WGM88936.1 MAG: isocitrate/isopropylmalate dehydrogenase family protein [Candidatus Bathyarchaeum tardum]WNZ28825.1 MAG: isocitrate/isopropylmalate dehydrogenase family protein [Candidatus Bathyarchaeota archaeon]